MCNDNSNESRGSIYLPTVKIGDLCILALGYFDLDDLHQMGKRRAYYISRLMLNARIYIKNSDPEYFKNGSVKKH